MEKDCKCVICPHLGCVDKYKDDRYNKLNVLHQKKNTELTNVKSKLKNAQKEKHQSRQRVRTLEKKIERIEKIQNARLD